MTPQTKLLLRLFGGGTFTTEIRPDGIVIKAEDIDKAVSDGYLYRHPGIFGSRCSYFRTEKGMEAWQELQNIQP